MKFCPRCGEYSDDANDQCKRCGKGPLAQSGGHVSASLWHKTFAGFGKTQRRSGPQEAPSNNVSLVPIPVISTETPEKAEYRTLSDLTTGCFLIYLAGIYLSTRLEHGQFSFAVIVIWPLLLLFPPLLARLERRESSGLTLAITTSLVGVGASGIWLTAQLLFRAISGPGTDPAAVVYLGVFGLMHMKLLTLAKKSLQSRGMTRALRSRLVIVGIISITLIFLMLAAFSQAV